MASDSIIDSAVQRYNAGCIRENMNDLTVNVNDVIDVRDELRRNVEGPLWESLWYSPRDLSVYVRTTSSAGTTLDVALCTQDVTDRSTVQFDDLLEGEFDQLPFEEERLKAVRSVEEEDPSRIARYFGRVVHYVHYHHPIVTVELARRFVPVRERTVVNVPVDEHFGRVGHERRAAEDHHLHRMREFLRSCATDFTNRRMTRNVNYEAMFRVKSSEYQDGRLTWPFVVGLVMAENLHSGIGREVEQRPYLRDLVGTYQGYYGPLQWTLLVLYFSGVTGFLASTGILLSRDEEQDKTQVMVAFASFLAVVCPDLVRVLSGETVIPPSDKRPPPTDTLERATAVLLSPSCSRHFDGEGLCFTGVTDYNGRTTFARAFTYTELCQMGFSKMCDARGREHLKVPLSQRKVVKMVRKTSRVDAFEPVGTIPMLFHKPWVSTNSPGSPNAPPEQLQQLGDHWQY